MAQIKETCKSYKFSFAQNITMLPGMQTYKVLGSKGVKEVQEVVANKLGPISLVLHRPVVINEIKKKTRPT